MPSASLSQPAQDSCCHAAPLRQAKTHSQTVHSHQILRACLADVCAGDWTFMSVPAVQPSGKSGAASPQSAVMTVPLWLLVIGFCIWLAYRAKVRLNHYMGQRHWTAVSAGVTHAR